MRRIVVPMLLLMTAIGTSSTPSRADDGSWAILPIEVRGHIHATTHLLPIFPESDDSLRDVKKWPGTRVFSGQSTQLRFGIEAGDVYHGTADSVFEVPDDLGYFAYYRMNEVYGDTLIAIIGDGEVQRTPVPVQRGPGYYWRPDRSVGRRDFHTDTGFRAWFYDTKGRVRQFIEERRATGEAAGWYVMEYFSDSGELQGFMLHIRPGSGARGPEHHYWRGRSISQKEYFQQRSEFRKALRHEQSLGN